MTMMWFIMQRGFLLAKLLKLANLVSGEVIQTASMLAGKGNLLLAKSPKNQAKNSVIKNG
jgi:hypothetical protein